MTRNYKGFTLVELLIVVAMIAIIAAVAGPQLTAYTVQGNNAMAAADLRNAVAAEKAFFADWGVYASSAGGGMAGQGMIFIGPQSGTGPISAKSISPTAPRASIMGGFVAAIAPGAAVLINTSQNGGSYTMVSKHAGGDRCFGADSDSKDVYWINGSIGQFLYGESAPQAMAGADDFSGVFGSGSCSGNPPGMGQYTWVAL